MSPVEVQQFDFGKLEYYDNYVISSILPNTQVTTSIAKTILTSVKDHFGNKKMVYISNREFGYDVDVSIYKLVNSKKMVAIAIVSSKREEIVVKAAKEQEVYKGSFGVFNSIESAVSWAQSFVTEHDN
ncbi:hypothetical protein SAMN05192588_1988 [Nonlabens sp. Hel1_33_55]|uniref:hypothetical protein n=1 Tax=Nonlabens sp. Hel1_33_55 TaxID=1336802 RepID=UPI000875EBB8|nr:hypothetical protein [Nonlabens sp. Hel1_33_55]SCY27331.1 hypothetical protein SAMN05192588_1988 [Nonlabens sp. Hel1_33_55]